MTAPTFRSVCQLTGDRAESPILKILDTANDIAVKAAAADLIRDAFTAAIGYYTCPCGSEFDFDDTSTLEDYAALNRWLGRHEVCAERSELYRQLEQAHAHISELSSGAALAAEDGPGAPVPPGGRPANPSQ